MSRINAFVTDKGALSVNHLPNLVIRLSAEVAIALDVRLVGKKFQGRSFIDAGGCQARPCGFRLNACWRDPEARHRFRLTLGRGRLAEGIRGKLP
jgi:hypothetical protein